VRKKPLKLLICLIQKGKYSENTDERSRERKWRTDSVVASSSSGGLAPPAGREVVLLLGIEQRSGDLAPPVDLGVS